MGKQQIKSILDNRVFVILGDYLNKTRFHLIRLFDQQSFRLTLMMITILNQESDFQNAQFMNNSGHSKSYGYYQEGTNSDFIMHLLITLRPIRYFET